MDRLKSIDAKIQQGWIYTQEKRDAIKGCDMWLEAWEEIKGLFSEGFAENVEDLDKKYKWSQWITNYVQYLEMELQNAGMRNPAYHGKRIDYCQGLLQWCGTDDLLIANTRCAMAEAHFDSGDEAGCDRLFEGWLLSDPDWGLGYRAWSECYLYKEGVTGYEKAEGILLAGYSRSGLRVEDKYEMTAYLMAIYDDTNRPEKFREFEQIFSELHSKMPGFDDADREFEKMLLETQPAKPVNAVYVKPEPVRVEKIGRNEPCPCGSGKKYKKCCGA